MKNVDIKLENGLGYAEAEKRAREAAKEMGGSLSLFAWYDKTRNMGAPREACAEEGWKCVRDYAEHHNADLRVSVNGDEYEFFFSKVPEDAAELDRESVEAVHTGIKMNRDENVQGG
ncbi:MAG: hypothetical protein Kow0099_00230 [Candidatus Abyssubacteria bacterium]